MAKSQTDNIIFDKGEPFVWKVRFYNDDDTPMDVSSYSFSWIMKDGSSVIWNISSFTRPNNYTIQFTKSTTEIGALTIGTKYSYSFKVTGGVYVSDEFINGYAILPE